MYTVTVTNGAYSIKVFTCNMVEFCVGYIKLIGDIKDVHHETVELEEVRIATNIVIVEKLKGQV